LTRNKIIFVCGAPFVSGKENVIIGLVDKLRGDFDISVLTSTWGNGDFFNRICDLNIRIYKIRLGFISKTLTLSALMMTFNQLVFIVKLYISYISIIRNEKPSVVIHTNFHHLCLLWPLLGLSKRNVFYIHECFEPSKFYKYMFRFLNIKIDDYVGISEFVASEFTQILPTVNVKVIYNTVLNMKGRLFPNKVENVIVVLGQIAPWKGHGVLIDALRILKNRNLKFRCLIYGHGEPLFMQTLKLKIQEAELTDYVFWMGFETDTLKIYKQASLVCVPSTFKEPLGMSALEPASLGIPVLASNIGGLVEILYGECSEFLFKVDDFNQLADLLYTYFENKHLYSTTSRRFYELTHQKFNDSKILDEWRLYLTPNNY
jgi:glycosyltransferase involved in cell wall biosynthesis